MFLEDESANHREKLPTFLIGIFFVNITTSIAIIITATGKTLKPVHHSTITIPVTVSTAKTCQTEKWILSHLSHSDLIYFQSKAKTFLLSKFLCNMRDLTLLLLVLNICTSWIYSIATTKISKKTFLTSTSSTRTIYVSDFVNALGGVFYFWLV